MHEKIAVPKDRLSLHDRAQSCVIPQWDPFPVHFVEQKAAERLVRFSGVEQVFKDVAYVAYAQGFV